MELALLGTMGWMPGEMRETTCVACRDGDTLLFFDAGSGLCRLREPAQAALVDGAGEAHFFLSHYHLDHVCGLSYLSGVLPGRRIVVHAPAAAITGSDPRVTLAGLIRSPYFPQNWDDLPGVSVEPLHAGANEVAGHTITLRRQEHTDVSVAYRLDDHFVFATDTGADPCPREFSAGVGLLLHEAWYNAADPRTEELPAAMRRGFAAHSEVTAVAREAAAAAVGRLVLIHLNPLYDEPYYDTLRKGAQRVFPAADVLPDGSRVATDTAV